MPIGGESSQKLQSWKYGSYPVDNCARTMSGLERWDCSKDGSAGRRAMLRERRAPVKTTILEKKKDCGREMRTLEKLKPGSPANGVRSEGSGIGRREVWNREGEGKRPWKQNNK